MTFRHIDIFAHNIRRANARTMPRVAILRVIASHCFVLLLAWEQPAKPQAPKCVRVCAFSGSCVFFFCVRVRWRADGRAGVPVGVGGWLVGLVRVLVSAGAWAVYLKCCRLPGTSSTIVRIARTTHWHAWLLNMQALASDDPRRAA